ncbi:hypothetical protein ABIE32_002516 [Comamonas sp. 4034]
MAAGQAFAWCRLAFYGEPQLPQRFGGVWVGSVMVGSRK